MASSKYMNLFKVAPILLGASFVAAQAQPVFAQSANGSEQELLQQIDNYNNQGNSNSLNQVNSVFQLRDVSPGDWAFEALRNLVERYGCIAGYPDGTFRGNRALTRFEFAAGLNACLQQIERLIAANTGGGSDVDQSDLATLQRLTQEFEAELATLGTRVDNLEGRVGFLEDNQFSTTTKLSGSVVFLAGGAFGSDQDDPNGSLFGQDTDSNPNIVYDAVLDFEASFTGRDELKVSLQASSPGDVIQNVGDAALDNPEGGNNSFEMEDLIYSFPLGQNVQVEIGLNDFDPDSAFDYSYGSGATLSDFTIDGEEAITDGTGAEDDVGISTNINLTDRLSLGVGYTTNDSNANDPDVGLFQDYSIAAGLNFSGDRFDVGIGYNFTETVGDDTILADDIDDNIANPVLYNEVTQNAIGARGAVRLGSRTEIGGFVEYIDASFEDTIQPNLNPEFDSEGWSFGANLAFFDIGKEGSTLGVAFASRAFFEDADFDNGGTVTLQQDRTYVAEVFYDFPVNDNVSITPGLVAVFNPDNDSDNSEVYVGVVRTTFSF
ncbi:putative S-layer protein [Dactylococcopsis salina PCC 8305]|uniref:S-layer protein n=2 Tax=Dactylococcopsis salina TaxID=292566 RepID=K9YTX1_DACS8|nr:putative S-layer protein [Dactylococcopsis salina PCC 8305]